MLGTLLEVKMFKKCTPLWREAYFEVNMLKAHHCRTTFGSCDLEKVHPAVARSTCASQKYSKVLTTDDLGPLLDVEMSTKCTPVWREAYLQVKRFQKLTVSDYFWTFNIHVSWQLQLQL